VKTKMPLGWHKECLSNRQINLARQEEELERMRKEVERSRQETAFLKLQIETAEASGKDGFDGDRYLKASNPKEPGRLSYSFPGFFFL
jgi:hypothetical protein